MVYYSLMSNIAIYFQSLLNCTISYIEAHLIAHLGVAATMACRNQLFTVVNRQLKAILFLGKMLKLIRCLYYTIFSYNHPIFYIFNSSFSMFSTSCGCTASLNVVNIRVRPMLSKYCLYRIL